MKRVFGYLRKFHKGKIIIDLVDPKFEEEVQMTTGQNWKEMYPDAVEDIPENIPEPLGKSLNITAFVDADHARDKVTCRSVTGVLLMLNNTPIQWVSKRQKTVETSTYGSELVAARVAVDMIVEMRYKLRMLGVPVKDASLLVGDNMSVVLNTSIPASPLKKKHLACAYNRVREMIAAGVINFGHIDSDKNLADLFTKPLGPQLFLSLVKKYLFRQPMFVKEEK